MGRGARTLGAQLTEIKRLHPHFSVQLRRNVLSCTGKLRPSDISDEYLITVTYDLNRRPKVFVVAPVLSGKDDKRIPHTFSDGSLCLHMPLEWLPSMSIAETILPWAALWLYYYELWHITDQWLGGGHEPGRHKHSNSPLQNPVD